jgi:hypothetical protein
MKGARNRAFLAPRRMKATNNMIPLPRQRFIPLPSNSNFDEYFLGPTLEDNATYPKYLDNFPTNPYAMPTIRSSWEHFRDYGYRLEPSFALMFNNLDPILVQEHLLPVGTSLAGESISDHITGDYSLARRGHEDINVDVNDIVTMGMEDMLSHAGRENSIESFNAFVCGRSSYGHYIHLSLEEDKVHLEEDEITSCFDIDSMIWVTHKLHFLQAIKMFVLPYERREAPIHRNNHVYVDILLPRSELDKDSGGRSEWLSKSFPLSGIPHTHFAHLGDGAGSVNIYVFFPRMIHRDEFRGFRVNRIPFEVQSLWFTEVVLPSIIASTVPGCLEYTDFTLDEWRWKASVNHRFVDTKTTPVRASALDDLQYCMKKIIRENPDNLDLFGSFFFVCDFRSSKGLTVEDDPYQALMREYPGMDWDYAMDRSNGQLFFDFGISFHPNPKDATPLVGLWKLPIVQGSYQAAGMKRSTIHNTNTLAQYGGMQAEMQQERMKAVQFTFRSSYGLYFEAIRRPGSNSYFCEDREAYFASPTFLDCCKRYLGMFKGAKRKSFGVREEIRGSGLAIKTALISAKRKASLLCVSGGFLLHL